MAGHDELVTRLYDGCDDATRDEAAGVIREQAKRIASLEAALEIAKEYLDNHSDCVDGDYGVPEPNDAMKCLQEIDEAMGKRYVQM